MRHIFIPALLASSAGLVQAERVQLPASSVIGKHQPDPTAPSIAERRAEFSHIPWRRQRPVCRPGVAAVSAVVADVGDVIRGIER